METMNISIPKAMKSFVDAQVGEGIYSSASEYVRRLIREDQERKGRDAVERKLLEALEGGSTPMTRKDWDDLRGELRARAAKRARK